MPDAGFAFIRNARHPSQRIKAGAPETKSLKTCTSLSCSHAHHRQLKARRDTTKSSTPLTSYIKGQAQASVVPRTVHERM